MNFTYFKFLFVTTVKKRPVWITCLLMLITCTMFIIVLPAVARMNTLQVWANTTMNACESFFGMTIALFTAVLGIHIFKDGIAEGTELIVISKPIKRYKIILTKFFVFGFFCLLANLLTVLITCFTIFLPTTEVKFYWGLVVSMFIGNAVTCMFYGALAIIMTVKAAKTGVIVVNILTSLVLIIYQILSLVVFKIPARSLADHGVVAPTYFLINRNEDGSYEEDRVVKFGLTDLNPTLSGEAAFTGTHWQDVEEYWRSEILKNDPSVLLNVTDIASQLGLSYLSYNVHGFSDRQGYRNFALSRHYTYTLTDPASSEILTTSKNNAKSLPWVYVGMSKKSTYFETYTWYQPSGFGFAGISPVSGNRLKGFGDQIPVGVYAPEGLAYTASDVYFEKEDYKKYCIDKAVGADKPYFEVMYDEIFKADDTIYPLPAESEPYLKQSSWCLNNANLNTYYERVWTALCGSTAKRIEKFGEDSPVSKWSKETFDISNIQDLNKRFIQFKYAAALYALAEQKSLFADLPTQQEELDAYNEAKTELSADNGVYDYLIAKNTGKYGAFMLENNGSDYSFVEKNTVVPDMTLLKATYDKLTTEEMQANSKYALYYKTSNIFSKCCSVNEHYLFSSINEFKRSADQTGRLYVINDDWYSYWNTIDLFQPVPKGQNMQYFYYEAKARVPYWIYAVIWSSISLCAFAAAFVLYYKFDFK